MDASLDTNILIHFYRANCEHIIFSLFENIYVHNFIVEVELRKHGTDIEEKVSKDIHSGKIILVNDEYLSSRKIKSIFDEYFRDESILYTPQDRGEVYAIAVARTLGVTAVITDDIKVYGPYFTLMQVIDGDIIPLSFNEVLFLSFVSEKLNADDYITNFNSINDSSGMGWDILKSTAKCIKRFNEPFQIREKEWIECFCQKYGTKFNEKARVLLCAIRDK